MPVKKVCMTGPGSAKPVVSMMIWSILLFLRSSFVSMRIKSPLQSTGTMFHTSAYISDMIYMCVNGWESLLCILKSILWL